MGIAIWIVACNSQQETTKKTRFVSPPFENVDVNYENFGVKAEEGGVLITKNGSILSFPKNSFVDEKGNLIKGEVQVSYREFNDQFDLLTAGIPMNYDSAGTSWLLESAAMTEVLAKQNGNPVFVNQDAKPSIALKSNVLEDNFNLYYLDTVAKNWVGIGRDLIIDPRDEGVYDLGDVAQPTLKPTLNKAKDNSGIELVKPQKPSGKMPSFFLTVDPNSFPELLSYDKLQFEYINKADIVPSDTDEVWTNVMIDHTKKSGIYLVTFSNKSKEHAILARPVYEGKSYDEAMKLFLEKEAEHQKTKLSRMVSDEKLLAEKKELEKKIAARKAENERIIKKNEKIKEENKKIEAQNEITRIKNIEIEEMNKRNQEYAREMKILIAKQQRINDSINADIRRNDSIDRVNSVKYSGINSNNNDVIFRTFTISKFGYYNCDHALPYQTTNLNITYYDEKNNNLNPKQVFVVLDSVRTYYSVQFVNKVGYMSGNSNWIIAVLNGKIGWVTASEFSNSIAGVNDNDPIKLNLHIHEGKISSTEELKNLVGMN